MAAARRSQPWLDHVVRAAGRYKADGGDRLAASLTFYGFLSLFPLHAARRLRPRLSPQRPPGAAAGDLRRAGRRRCPASPTRSRRTSTLIRDNAGKTGIVALIGVLLAGLGGVTALRDSLRLMWHQSTSGRQPRRRAGCAPCVTLLGLGRDAGRFGGVVRRRVEPDGHAARRARRGHRPFARLGGMHHGGRSSRCSADIALFLFLFRRLPDGRLAVPPGAPRRGLRRGGLRGAQGGRDLLRRPGGGQQQRASTGRSAR